MSGRHARSSGSSGRGTIAERLYVPGRSAGRARPYRLAPAAKLVGLIVFVVAVALTPRRALPVFAIDATLVLVALAAARLRPRVLIYRLVIVVPFVVMACLIAFIGHGPRVEVAGLSMSRDGLWAAWNITVKALLGASASIIFAATTPLPAVLRAMTVLRAPSMLVSIVAFMFRYLDVLTDEFAQTRRAMIARGHDPRWLWQAGPLASAAGAMFVRSYERGERVHRAMSARGFTGAMPDLSSGSQGDSPTRPWCDWLLALAPGAVAVVALAVFVGLGR